MKAWSIIVLSAAISVECAAGAASYAEGRSYPSRVFRGQSEHLEQLVRAGRACGYGVHELDVELETPHLTPVVILEIPARREARFECVMQWIRNHPETGFGS